MSKHTQTPWLNDKYGSVYTGETWNNVKVRGFALSSGPEPEANTAFIVKAVNAHVPLVAAAKAALDMICEEVADGKFTEQAELLREALAAAEAQ